jgi:two-component system sensor histidine kinase RegB
MSETAGQVTASVADLGPDARPEEPRLRLKTLVTLRWLAILGQFIAVIAVHGGLGFDLPLLPALGIIGFSAALNLALVIRYPVSHRVEEQAAAGFLAYDVLQLAALLYLTGGLQNPFAFLFLAPVMISATTLAPQRTLALGVIAVLAATGLAVWHQPLPWEPTGSVALPPLYIAGVWLSILLGIGFIGLYAWRLTEESRQLSDALAATELALTRETHLSHIDGLAAAAAHELGTPLATIALVVKEMERGSGPEDPHRDDIQLLAEQIARCRAILSKIASLGDETAGPMQTQTVQHLIEEIAAPLRQFGAAITIHVDGAEPQPVCPRDPGLMHGLANIVENAVDFALAAVTITASWDETRVEIAVKDDGPGFASEVLARLGEPYLTTRSGREGGGGLGLGLFIAKTLLERGGARLRVGNASGSERGAVVRLSWPRAVFERRAGSRA